MKTPEEIKKGLECCIGDNHEYHCDLCPYNTGEELVGCVDEGLSLYEDALTLIQQLEARVPRWISAKTPPKDWQKNDKDKTLINYQVYSPDYGVDIGNWIERAKMWVIMGLPAKVTHWMPLPEAPKEDAHG